MASPENQFTRSVRRSSQLPLIAVQLCSHTGAEDLLEKHKDQTAKIDILEKPAVAEYNKRIDSSMEPGPVVQVASLNPNLL